MKTYTYQTANNKLTFRLKFSSNIYPRIKKEFDKILDVEIQKNPYNAEILASIIHEFHLKASKDHEIEPVVTREQILEHVDVDEMVQIYSHLMLERGAFISTGLTVDKK